MRALACFLVAATVTVTLAAQGPPRLTVKDLEALQSSSNDPGGDFFGGTPQKLNTLLDAMVADSSLMSPMYLLVAANTAIRLGRVEDAAFFLYASQIRAAFDFERYDISARPDGNNAATYLGFLNHTTGEAVNPAIHREPKLFASVIQRIERWEVVPAADAFYPEFEDAKGFRTKREDWPARGQALKNDFLDKFGRRYAKLLNDPEFFAAYMILQDVVPLDEDPNAIARVDAAIERMDEIEVRLFPGEPTARQRLSALREKELQASDDASDPAVASERERTSSPDPMPADELPVRVGGKVPTPKKIEHVEPVFPAGTRGSMIVELMINREGRVVAFNVLRGDFGLFAAAETAIRQWVFEPVMIDGKPVSVLQAFTITAK